MDYTKQIAIAVAHLRFGTRRADVESWAWVATQLGFDSAWAIEWIYQGYPEPPGWIARQVDIEAAHDEALKEEMKNKKWVDSRIVYGMGCTWWSEIQNVGSNKIGSYSLPCCPHCKGTLMEMESITEWQINVDFYAKDRPGYAEFVTWLKGKCYTFNKGGMRAAVAAYTAETGKSLQL